MEPQKTIVAIEDQEILAHLIEEKLSRAGYAVRIAFNGSEGLKLIRAARPDLVLLDMGLPKIDGFGVLEALHAEKILPALPVIIISNTGERIEVDRAKALGVRDYLIKVNFDPDELTAKVKQLFQAPLETRGVGRPAGAPALLIVEDEAFFVELLEQKFMGVGFTVRHAASADEARAALASGRVDAILLDILLPGEDGISLLRALREDPALKNTPVMVLSNLSQREEMERAMAAGANEYVIKAHVDLNDIVERVRKLLQPLSA